MNLTYSSLIILLLLLSNLFGCNAVAMAQNSAASRTLSQPGPVLPPEPDASWPSPPSAHPAPAQRTGGLKLQHSIANKIAAERTLKFSLQLTASVPFAGQTYTFSSIGLINKAGSYAMTITTANDTNDLYCDGQNVIDYNPTAQNYCSVPIGLGDNGQDKAIKAAVQSADPSISSASVFADAAQSVYWFATGGIFSSPAKSLIAYRDNYNGLSVYDLFQSDSNDAVSTEATFAMDPFDYKPIAENSKLTLKSLNITAVNNIVFTSFILSPTAPPVKAFVFTPPAGAHRVNATP